MAIRRLFPLFALIALLALTFGCGGSNSGSNNQNAATQQVVVTIGDDPVGRVVAFSVTLESVKLIPVSGDPVTVLSTPMTIELTQLAGGAFPIGVATIPQGTYRGAELVLSHPSITMIDPATGNPVSKTLPPDPRTVMVAFNPAIAVGSTPSEIHFDINLLGSITIDASGNVTFTPRVLGSMPPPSNPIRHIMGTITAVGTDSFTLSTMMGQKSITFMVSAATRYLGEGISGLADLKTGMLAVVDATLQSDGKPLALVVAAKLLPPPGIIPVGLEGFVFKVNTDGTQFQMVLQGAVGPRPAAMLPITMPGMLVTINVTSATVFRVDDDNVDLSGITLPSFSAATLKPGQRVRVASTFNLLSATPVMGMPAALLNAEKVELVQQGLFGTVSNYDSATGNFTLTVPIDAALSTVTGVAVGAPARAVEVSVRQQSLTKVNGTVANGATVLVRGLLFNDSGNFTMVASVIVVPTATTTP